ncbi:MAG: ATP/GTP-binding protein [Actinomycetota bacterium]|nr:ATP/GTP-binding protein [Actinomycetota bacterium]
MGEEMSPQPPPPPGGGQESGLYLWVMQVCYVNGVETSRTPVWTSPSQRALDVNLQPIDPAVLAAQAIASMTLLAPPIEMMPPQGSEGAITGVPVWMWLTQGVTTTGTNSASASAGGVTVTTVANVTEVAWDMGDGSTVSCGIGTPYDPGYGGSPSPTCGYVYEVKSTKDDPNGVYTVTATSTWTITWAGGGETGVEVMELSSSVPLRVTEINVINVPGG